MLDVELPHFEVEHLHDFFQVLIACSYQFGRLLQPKLNNMILVGKEIECYNVELTFVHCHLHDAFDVVLSNHAQVSPEDSSFLAQQDRATHLHGVLRDEDLEDFGVVSEHGQRRLLKLFELRACDAHASVLRAFRNLRHLRLLLDRSPLIFRHR